MVPQYTRIGKNLKLLPYASAQIYIKLNFQVCSVPRHLVLTNTQERRQDYKATTNKQTSTIIITFSMFLVCDKITYLCQLRFPGPYDRKTAASLPIARGGSPILLHHLIYDDTLHYYWVVICSYNNCCYGL